MESVIDEMIFMLLKKFFFGQNTLDCLLQIDTLLYTVHMKTITALNWRYATKEFDQTKKLSKEQFDMVTEALRLSASSYGLQPWKFIVVNTPALRAQIREAAWGQAQITDASHLIVLTVVQNVVDAYVDRYVQSVAHTRGMTVDMLTGYADMMKGAIAGKGGADRVKDWSSRQVYIALGTALTALAVEGIDACPMEGFDPVKVDAILGLGKLGLESRALLAVGFRSAGDKTAAYKKARFAKEEVVVEM